MHNRYGSMLVVAMLPALRPTCCCLARERSRLSSWDLFGGFAEELKISQDGVIDEFIAFELLSTETGCVADHLAAELPHVLQKKRPVTGGALISQGQQPPVQSAP